jgi:hypothetical protein
MHQIQNIFAGKNSIADRFIANATAEELGS